MDEVVRLGVGVPQQVACLCVAHAEQSLGLQIGAVGTIEAVRNGDGGCVVEGSKFGTFGEDGCKERGGWRGGAKRGNGNRYGRRRCYGVGPGYSQVRGSGVKGVEGASSGDESDSLGARREVGAAGRGVSMRYSIRVGEDEPAES